MPHRPSSPRAIPRLASLALAGCVASAAWQSAAAQTWYTVELIVFEQLDDAGLHAEHWPLDPGTPPIGGSIQLVGASDLPLGDDAENAGSPRAFQLLPAGQFRLAETWTRLRRSRGFRPIAHLAWHQPGFSRNKARSVYIRTGRSSRRENTATVAEPQKVQGTVRLYRARYLHIDVNLLYHRPGARVAPMTASGDEADAQPPSRSPRLFRLSTSRRMRSRELHYLDHPVFGVIVQVSPYVARGRAQNPGESGEPAEKARGEDS